MGIKIFLKNLILFFKYRKKVNFDFTCDIALNNSEFEGANSIGPHSIFAGKLGYGTYMANNCHIIANIGRFTSIGPYVRTNRGVHPISEPYATTCPMFYSTQKKNGKTFVNRMMFDEFLQTPEIGNDVWIQENVFFSAGITIGDGAVILAGAVVTKDVPPYAIVGGVPAKILKYRYDDDTIKFLLNYKWWNKGIEWFESNWMLMCNIEQLKRDSSSFII